VQAVVHRVSEKQLLAVMHDLPQSLLLTGDKGVGLLTVAKEIAGKNIAGILQPVDKKEVVDLENGTIAIEMIRRLYNQTRSKQTSAQIIIIDDADRMSRGAQAAFLKLLEEPTLHTHFILTSHTPEALVSTIRSRVEQLHIQPLTAEQTAGYITQLNVTDPTLRRQIEFIAPGLPAELSRLVAENNYFKERAEVTTDARDFLTGNPYKKMLIIQKYQANRGKTLQLLDSTLMLARRSMSTKPQPELIRELTQILAVRELIEGNQSIKLQLALTVL
jgi:replication-associated recombination protein RarA